MLSRSLAAFLVSLSLLIPVVAPAGSNYFIITPGAKTQTTETIELSVWINDVYGTCPIPPGLCVNTYVTARVSPCPPGMPCTNGASEIGFVLGDHRTVLLRLGTTYTFEGSAESQVGTVWNSTCTVTCIHTQPVDSQNYETGAPPPPDTEWEVSPVSSNGDTVWVDLGMTNVKTDNFCSQLTHCAILDAIRCHVTPCPLWASDPDVCSYGLQFGPGSTARIGLRAGVAYTFHGGYYASVWELLRPDDCADSPCRFEQLPADMLYITPTLAVTPITWGAVKSMYRTP